MVSLYRSTTDPNGLSNIRENSNSGFVHMDFGSDRANSDGGDRFLLGDDGSYPSDVRALCVRLRDGDRSHVYVGSHRQNLHGLRDDHDDRDPSLDFLGVVAQVGLDFLGEDAQVGSDFLGVDAQVGSDFLVAGRAEVTVAVRAEVTVAVQAEVTVAVRAEVTVAVRAEVTVAAQAEVAALVPGVVLAEAMDAKAPMVFRVMAVLHHHRNRLFPACSVRRLLEAQHLQSLLCSMRASVVSFKIPHLGVSLALLFGPKDH